MQITIEIIDGHGTHVAGTAAGRFHGVAKGAQVYFCKSKWFRGSNLIVVLVFQQLIVLMY